MKRLIALIAALILLGGSAAAETPDMSGLTPDELLSVIRQAQLLLFDQQLVDGIHVPQGTYVIGEDIPAGTYRIEITDGTGYYDLRDPDGNLKHTGVTGKFYNVTEIGKLILEEGYTLHLANSGFIFYPYTGIFH